MPLIFGGQRFALSSGLASKQSDLSVSVAESLAWSTGELGLVSDTEVEAAVQAGQRLRRRLQAWATGSNGTADGTEETDAPVAAKGVASARRPHELIALLDLIVTFGIAMGSVVMVQTLGILAWTFCVNRKFYAVQRSMKEDLPPSLRDPADSDIAEEGKGRVVPQRPPSSMAPSSPSRVAPAKMLTPSAAFVSPPPSPSLALVPTDTAHSHPSADAVVPFDADPLVHSPAWQAALRLQSARRAAVAVRSYHLKLVRLRAEAELEVVATRLQCAYRSRLARQRLDQAQAAMLREAAARKLQSAQMRRSYERKGARALHQARGVSHHCRIQFEPCDEPNEELKGEERVIYVAVQKATGAPVGILLDWRTVYDVPIVGSRGLRVGYVEPGSTLAGLIRPGEVIVGINGKQVSSPQGAASLLQRTSNLTMRVVTDVKLTAADCCGRDAIEEVVTECFLRLPRFKPLPAFLVFPNLLVLPFWLFNPGLVRKAVALLAWQVTHQGDSSAVCGGGCTLLAVSVLLCIVAVIVLSFFMVINFWRHLRPLSWKDVAPVVHAGQVADPFFRLVSQIKLALSACCRASPPVPTDEEVVAAFETHACGKVILKSARDGSLTPHDAHAHKYHPSSTLSTLPLVRLTHLSAWCVAQGVISGTEVLAALHELWVMSPLSSSSQKSLFHSITRSSQAHSSIAEATMTTSQTRSSIAKNASNVFTVTTVATQHSTITCASSPVTAGSNKMLVVRKRARTEARSMRGISRTLHASEAWRGDGSVDLVEFRRLVAQITHRITYLRPRERMLGKWTNPPADVAEPVRTERLLEHPFRVLHSHVGDARESMMFHLFAKVQCA